MFTASKFNFNCSRLLCVVFAMGVAISLLPGTVSNASDTAGIPSAQWPAADDFFLPGELGEVVYRKNGHCPQQIFIIGQSHRSSVTDRAWPDTVKVQAEIYRIGEWLIREKHVGLLLPEGFFRDAPGEAGFQDATVRDNIRLDDQTLAAELGDTSRFVNADLLLSASYNVRLAQIEDERLYRTIKDLLFKARREQSLSSLAALDRLQTARTAALLQNIPGTVEKAFQAGKIDNRMAMFTIGMAHVGDIIAFLESGSLRPPAERSDISPGQMSEAGLKLLEQGYGVTVIIPRTLAEDVQALRLCRLKTKS